MGGLSSDLQVIVTVLYRFVLVYFSTVIPKVLFDKILSDGRVANSVRSLLLSVPLFSSRWHQSLRQKVSRKTSQAQKKSIKNLDGGSILSRFDNIMCFKHFCIPVGVLHFTLRNNHKEGYNSSVVDFLGFHQPHFHLTKLQWPWM